MKRALLPPSFMNCPRGDNGFERQREGSALALRGPSAARRGGFADADGSLHPGRRKAARIASGGLAVKFEIRSYPA